MYDTGTVRRGKRTGDLYRNIEHLSYFQFGSTDKIAKRSTLDEFAYDKVCVLADADLVDHKNIWMV
jgi:hypothetical protein